MENIKTIAINAGHCLDGNAFCGAVGHKKESTENRKVANDVKQKLENMGYKVIVCNNDKAKSKLENLGDIVTKANASKADIFISIHFNASDNPSAHGTEVWIYDSNSKLKKEAEAISSAIAKTGFANRGVKLNDFYVLKHTKMPALLVECCFVTNETDMAKYQASKMGDAIVAGLGLKNLKPVAPAVKPVAPTKPAVSTSEKVIYQVIAGSFADKANAEKMKKELELKGFKGAFLEATRK